MSQEGFGDFSPITPGNQTGGHLFQQKPRWPTQSPWVEWGISGARGIKLAIPFPRGLIGGPLIPAGTTLANPRPRGWSGEPCIQSPQLANPAPGLVGPIFLSPQAAWPSLGDDRVGPRLFSEV